MNKNMLIVTSSWRDDRTFKMIPLDKECPFNECIFDPINKVLAIVSKEYKNNVHMLPVLDSFGNITRDIPKVLREQGIQYRQERIMMDTYYEYFIREKDEIIEFVEKFGINSDNYDFKTIVVNSFDRVEEEQTV